MKFQSALCLLAVSPAITNAFVSRTSSAVPTSVATATTTTSLNAERRVVVTGMGITSCLGNTLEDVKTSLHEANPGITFQEEFAELGIKSNVAGVPDLSEADFKELIPKSALRFMGMNARYAYIALDRAIQDSGLKPEEYEENSRVAAIIGQGGTSIPDIVETCDAVKAGGKRWKNKVGPFRVTRSMGSTCSAVLATNFKVQGPSFSISSACSTGAHCIGTGFEQILLNKCDMAFCGAGENVNWQFTSMFDCMGALSTSYNESPKTASRAFDKTRDGCYSRWGWYGHP
jgi:3-oxoacyl-[acyl-carrier-protein] synthase-1